MKILDRLPYATEHVTETVRDDAVRIRPYQITVHVSVSVQTLLEWDPRVPCFPAVLDTGNNHNFSIRRSHLVRWAGLQPEALDAIGAVRERQQRLPLHAAALWLHRNVPGERGRRTDREPHPLEVREGITVYPDDTGPRVPVLGLRALARNELHLVIDGQRREVSLRTADWRTRLLRWLS